MPPLGGTLKDGRIYGRGVSDMKAGIAAALTAFRILAGLRERWRGELVMTLAGDEENMGSLGSRWLLEHVPASKRRRDVVRRRWLANGLALRREGALWVEVEAEGRPAHGAHVHKRRQRDRSASKSAGRAETVWRTFRSPRPRRSLRQSMTAKPISEDICRARARQKPCSASP